jgi:hypothetical protein
LSREATAPARSAPSLVGNLAKFFAAATPVRIPVQLSKLEGAPASESVVIEFGTPREVLFAAHTALEFGDKVRIQNSDGSLRADAAVVAVQYHEGKTVVAARFLRDVANWIVKP